MSAPVALPRAPATTRIDRETYRRLAGRVKLPAGHQPRDRAFEHHASAEARAVLGH